MPNYSLLKPTEQQQSEALLAAMSEILWNIGEKTRVVVVLPGEVPHIAHSHTYFQDTVTEKVTNSFGLFFLILVESEVNKKK